MKPPPSDTGQQRRTSSRRTVTVFGLLLLVVGLGSLGYVSWQLWGTNLQSDQAYRDQRNELKQQWRAASDPDTSPGTAHHPALPGDAIALLTIPAIGLHETPVLEGTGDDVLARGIGHYRKTAAPGQVGNFAVAGHRITHGEPFANLLRLREGDRVVVETHDAVYTYAIDTAPRTRTVTDTEGWVLDPVPGAQHAEPTEALITLTTCQDLFHSPDRSVGFGHLIDTHHKTGAQHQS